MLLSLPLNGFVATKLKHYQVKQMQRKDERVKLMNETLNGIKVKLVLRILKGLLISSIKHLCWRKSIDAEDTSFLHF